MYECREGKTNHVDDTNYRWMIQKHLKNKLFEESNNLKPLKTCSSCKASIRTGFGFSKVKRKSHSFKSQYNSSFLLWLAIYGLICNTIWLSEAGRSTGVEGRRWRKHIGAMDKNTHCEAIEIPHCRDVGYNYTDMSLSPANMVKQSDAAPAVGNN